MINSTSFLEITKCGNATIFSEVFTYDNKSVFINLNHFSWIIFQPMLSDAKIINVRNYLYLYGLKTNYESFWLLVRFYFLDLLWWISLHFLLLTIKYYTVNMRIFQLWFISKLELLFLLAFIYLKYSKLVHIQFSL